MTTNHNPLQVSDTLLFDTDGTAGHGLELDNLGNVLPVDVEPPQQPIPSYHPMVGWYYPAHAPVGMHVPSGIEAPRFVPPNLMGPLQVGPNEGFKASAAKKVPKSRKFTQPIVQECICSPETGAKIPRPKNAFIMFRADHTKAITRGQKHADGRTVSKVAADMWANAPEATKAHYAELASEEKARHAFKYPNYKYDPIALHKAKFGNPSCTCGAYTINTRALHPATGDRSSYASSTVGSTPIENSPVYLPPATIMAPTARMEPAGFLPPAGYVHAAALMSPVAAENARASVGIPSDVLSFPALTQQQTNVEVGEQSGSKRKRNEAEDEVVYESPPQKRHLGDNNAAFLDLEMQPGGLSSVNDWKFTETDWAQLETLLAMPQQDFDQACTSTMVAAQSFDDDSGFSVASSEHNTGSAAPSRRSSRIEQKRKQSKDYVVIE